MYAGDLESATTEEPTTTLATPVSTAIFDNVVAVSAEALACAAAFACAIAAAVAAAVGCAVARAIAVTAVIGVCVLGCDRRATLCSATRRCSTRTVDCSELGATV